MASHNGHDYVEIGGIKWATMNVGASSVIDYGLYFQWGDTTGYLSGSCGSIDTEYKMRFIWADYKFGNGTNAPLATGMTKYNASDGKTVLGLSDDAARANWGGSWRMPTLEECVILGNAVNTTWTTDYQGGGVAGMVCTDKTDSSKVLFFPACGGCDNGNVSRLDRCRYWTSSAYNDDDTHPQAYRLYLYDGFINWQDHYRRYNGYPVRGVVGE